MKTSTRKYNKQYREAHIWIDGEGNPKKVLQCNTHTRCDKCRSHVRFYEYLFDDEGQFLVYKCPTCGKCFAALWGKSWDWTGEENDDE